MAKDPEWMPVFDVMPGVRDFYAAHPDEKVIRKHKQEKRFEDQLQRIGTAIAVPGGGFSITLRSLPRRRRLFIRPPKAHEGIDD